MGYIRRTVRKIVINSSGTAHGGHMNHAIRCRLARFIVSCDISSAHREQKLIRLCFRNILSSHALTRTGDFSMYMLVELSVCNRCSI